MLSFENWVSGRDRRVLLRPREPFKPGIHWLVGANGSGKSTFLQTLAGLIEPLEGKALWNGQPLQPHATVAYLPEYLVHLSMIRPDEWISFVAGKRWSPDASAAWGALGLSGFERRTLGTMSQGERRKVNWTAMDASARPLVLLDEPFNGLDAPAWLQTQDLLENWRRQGRVVIIVSHQWMSWQVVRPKLWLLKEKEVRPWTPPEAETEFLEALRKELV